MSEIRFLGNIEAKTDVKGRVFLPAVFRKVLQGSGDEVLVLRKDVHQPCLVLYPLSVWNKRIDTLMQRVNEFDRASKMVLRQYASEAMELTLDGNGRFLIPKEYLAKAQINQSVRFLGINDTIEIWSAENTEQPFLSDEDFASQLEALMVTTPKTV